MVVGFRMGCSSTGGVGAGLCLATRDIARLYVIGKEARLEKRVHLGPEKLSGGWRIVFEYPCRRPGSEHGEGVVCESLTYARAERLKWNLVRLGELSEWPKIWPDRARVVDFLNKQLLVASGHRVAAR
ncbi:MAG: hypothetical protein DMG21_05700 [Acidobacteria bacterium]|nr:MAG: hypothetical protein DMG21_05700 [Acidobacteriota bacterium]